jgi:hypothetical protein
MFDDIDLNAIQDENARQLIHRLLNLIEKVSADLRDAQEENQRLRDENNRLKGEQGKPKVKANTPKPAVESGQYSSEKERQKRHRHSKGSKKAQLQIDREQFGKVDPGRLPADAEFKGYADVVVQDLGVKTDNICFHQEKYSAASTRQTYQAKLPQGYEGQFGPGLKALVPTLYFGMNTSEPKILEFFEYVGICISEGELSNLLIKDQGDFHTEKAEVYEAGLRSSPWQHTDDTQTRVAGQHQHCHVLCNPVYTVDQTLPKKDRLSVLDVLRHGRARVFRLNPEALGYLEHLPFSKAHWQVLRNGCSDREPGLDEPTFLAWLDGVLPDLGTQQRKAIIDAAAVAAYHLEKDRPVIRALVCDDAPQFNWLTEEMMLCWVHEGRPYKKLMPVIPLHRQQLEDFRKCFWEYYDQLLAYRQKPTPAERERLEAEFDRLFATRTGYEALDQRIAKSQAKKDSLLLVLKHPELPLHNNPAELGARQRVRKRDVSFGPRTQDGVQAWDTFMSLAETTKKLGVSFYQYIHDRISGANQIPRLADLVEMAAKKLNLGSSWAISTSTPSF